MGQKAVEMGGRAQKDQEGHNPQGQTGSREKEEWGKGSNDDEAHRHQEHGDVFR